MKRCDQCKKIIWPWQGSFYFQFSDIKKKQLCSGCFCGLIEFMQDILATQRDYFLNELLKRDVCVMGSMNDCEKLETDCYTPREKICSKCWCDASRD